jgi:Flp pilus assembly protein TadB
VEEDEVAERDNLIQYKTRQDKTRKGSKQEMEMESLRTDSPLTRLVVRSFLQFLSSGMILILLLLLLLLLLLIFFVFFFFIFFIIFGRLSELGFCHFTRVPRFLELVGAVMDAKLRLWEFLQQELCSEKLCFCTWKKRSTRINNSEEVQGMELSLK